MPMRSWSKLGVKMGIASGEVGSSRAVDSE